MREKELQFGKFFTKAVNSYLRYLDKRIDSDIFCVYGILAIRTKVLSIRKDL